MATTTYDLVETWSGTNRYTASGETDVLISNTGGGHVQWSITTNDTEPTIDPRRGHPLGHHESRAMTLADGERIWFAGAGVLVSLES